MNEDYFKKVISIIFLLALLTLSFLLIRPLFVSIFIGLILAYIFNPLFRYFTKLFKNKSFSALLVCFIVIVLLILPIWFLTPVLVRQSFDIYKYTRQINIIEPLRNIFPNIFASEEITQQFAAAFNNFTSQISTTVIDAFTEMLINIPTIMLHLTIVFFIMFFILRDKQLLYQYIKTFSPFPEETEKRFIKESKAVTNSVIYGQILVGIFQGILTGIGLYLFGVPNALFLTLLAMGTGMLPIVGPGLIWVPSVIYLVYIGSTIPALGLLIYGLVASWIEVILRPLIVSRNTKMPPSIVLIGMIGGLFIFGVIGFILGPLILAYLIIMLELYRGRRKKSVFRENKPNK